MIDQITLTKHQVTLTTIEKLIPLAIDRILWRRNDNSYYVSLHVLLDELSLSLFSEDLTKLQAELLEIDYDLEKREW